MGYLKKQSQFAAGQIGVKSYMKGNYGNMPACGLRKTKPIQSQFVSVQCSAFSVQRQNKEKVFEKTNPIFKWAKWC
jgi:hypothetical protein